ncbi:MAG: hypothetical protein AB1609_00745 [Bacillota bacterium]
MDADKALREGELLEALTRTPGWLLVDQHIQGQVEARLRELERTKFDDLAQVARIQGEIAGLRAINTYLQDRLRRYAEALQKGDR